MLFLRAIWLPGSAVAATLFWIWLDHYLRWGGPQLVWPGLALIVLGTFLALWCVALLLRRGQGSPHPFVAKTKRLVIVGPYRIVRNPMMWGIGAILVGLCLLLGAGTLWIGFVGFFLFIYWFVPNFEERDLEARFGEEFREYCRQVPRWVPRLKAQPRAAKGARVAGR